MLLNTLHVCVHGLDLASPQIWRVDFVPKCPLHFWIYLVSSPVTCLSASNKLPSTSFYFNNHFPPGSLPSTTTPFLHRVRRAGFLNWFIFDHAQSVCDFLSRHLESQQTVCRTVRTLSQSARSKSWAAILLESSTPLIGTFLLFDNVLSLVLLQEVIPVMVISQEIIPQETITQESITQENITKVNSPLTGKLQERTLLTLSVTANFTIQIQRFTVLQAVTMSRDGVYPLVKIDGRGDLTFVVSEGKNKKGFVVCSRTVARASKPLEAMLFGPFLEARPSDPSTPWIVRLPDDDPAAFKIMLNAIHHTNLDKIPKEIDRILLSKIIMLADKYLMTEYLRRIVGTWNIPCQDFTWPDDDDEVTWLIDISIGGEHPKPGDVRAALIIAHFMGHESTVWHALVYYAGTFQLHGGELILRRRYRFRAKDGNTELARLGFSYGLWDDESSDDDEECSAAVESSPTEDGWVTCQETERLVDELQGLPQVYTG